MDDTPRNFKDYITQRYAGSDFTIVATREENVDGVDIMKYTVAVNLDISIIGANEQKDIMRDAAERARELTKLVGKT